MSEGLADSSNIIISSSEYYSKSCLVHDFSENGKDVFLSMKMLMLIFLHFPGINST